VLSFVSVCEAYANEEEIYKSSCCLLSELIAVEGNSEWSGS